MSKALERVYAARRRKGVMTKDEIRHAELGYGLYSDFRQRLIMASIMPNKQGRDVMRQLVWPLRLMQIAPEPAYAEPPKFGRGASLKIRSYRGRRWRNVPIKGRYKPAYPLPISGPRQVLPPVKLKFNRKMK